MSRYFAASPDELVDDGVAGFARAHDDIVRHVRNPGYLAALAPHPNRAVALVSGGGSGHEPLHAGFVGRGMLDAACPGRIFTSPHNRQIYEAGKDVARPGGVLHIVKNYTGDRINFGIAAERLQHDGIACRRVLVDDDLATESEQIAVGRRGTAATVVVEKVLGAAADEGRDLDALAALGQRVTEASRSLAVASAAQRTPVQGEPAFTLDPGTLEYGVGIHGERADETSPDPGVDALVERVSTSLLRALGLESGSEVIALVNGLGSTTPLELYGLYQRLGNRLADAGVTPARSLVGSVVTALDMRGFSVTLTRADEEITRLWDAPAQTAAWTGREKGASQ